MVQLLYGTPLSWFLAHVGGIFNGLDVPLLPASLEDCVRMRKLKYMCGFQPAGVEKAGININWAKHHGILAGRYHSMAASGRLAGGPSLA
jgi:hypothetical protein